MLDHSEAIAKILEETVLAAAAQYDKEKGSIQDSVLDVITIAWKQFDSRALALTTGQTALRKFEASAQGTEKFQRKKFLANVKKAIGIDIKLLVSQHATQQAIANAVRDNISLISSISDSYKQRAQNIIEKAIFAGSDFASLKKELLNLGGFKEKFQGTETRRARTIARDQMQKLTSSINEARQVDAGITHYFWEIADRERVRDTHERNDGRRFAWASPPSTGHPGDEINCRCVARPDLSTLIDREENGL